MAIASCPMANGYLGIGNGWIFQLIILIIFIFVVWWLFKSNPSFWKWETYQDESASKILKGRFAKGEITKKEYEQLKQEIME